LWDLPSQALLQASGGSVSNGLCGSGHRNVASCQWWVGDSVGVVSIKDKACCPLEARESVEPEGDGVSITRWEVSVNPVGNRE